MRHSTYSFLDLAGAIAHPSYPGGPYMFTGEGVGTVTVSMQTERTAHDVAADGSIMISKIAGNNGYINIECQQTSLVHKYLLGLHSYLIAESAMQWAMAAIVLRNVSDGTSHIATGVSFGKIPDKAYSSQGAKVTWQLWAADIVTMNA
jgi:hypothetical protein